MQHRRFSDKLNSIEVTFHCTTVSETKSPWRPNHLQSSETERS